MYQVKRGGLCSGAEYLQQESMEKLAKTVTAAFIAAFLTACSTNGNSIYSKHFWRIEQNTQGQFVYCQTGADCPERTRKTLAVRDAKPLPPPSLPGPDRPKVVTQVYFGFAKANLTASGKKILINVLPEMKGEKRLLIRGWTDPVGGKTSLVNQKLAKSRAIAVKNWLIKAGVDSSSIKVETQPPCCNNPNATSKSPETVRSKMRTVTVELLL